MIFGLLNPLGLSPIPLLLSQIVGGILIGFVGGFCNEKGWNKSYIFGLLGFILTILYDLLTTFGGAILFFPKKKTLSAYLLAGLPFNLWHIFTQVFIYGVILSQIAKKIKRKEALCC